VEKTLEVKERRSTVKTFFVMEGVQKSCIAITIMALFLLSPSFYKMKIKRWAHKALLEFEVKKYYKKRN
jgi:hypothetical protein